MREITGGCGSEGSSSVCYFIKKANSNNNITTEELTHRFILYATSSSSTFLFKTFFKAQLNCLRLMFLSAHFPTSFKSTVKNHV